MSAEQLAHQIDLNNQELNAQHLSVPRAKHLAYFLAALGPANLNALLNRHLSPDRVGIFGTPDLFLYAYSEATAMLAFSRFVEVKRPGERMTLDQQEEIKFMQGLGLKARKLILKERNSAP